jgi:D-alanine-D-alanine ligase
MKIAVCFNLVPPSLSKGETSDRISEEGAEIEAQAVSGALAGLGFEPVLIPLGSDIEAFARDLRLCAPEIAFNLCEGFWGESRKEMHVAALFELLGITYTGAPPLCLGLTQDKVRTKDLLLRHRLPTPKYVLVRSGEQNSAKRLDLNWPLFVKPRFEDASLGITNESIVETEAALQSRIRYIHEKYQQDALVEEFIEGREFNAALIGSSPFETLPLSEIRFEKGLARSIVSYDGKWREDSSDYLKTQPLCPAPLKSREDLLLRDVALRACKLLDCRDYARVDIRLRQGIPHILEVNANPDISPEAGLARAARAGGISYRRLIDRIVKMALRRKELVNAKA